VVRHGDNGCGGRGRVQARSAWLRRSTRGACLERHGPAELATPRSSYGTNVGGHQVHRSCVAWMVITSYCGSPDVDGDGWREAGVSAEIVPPPSYGGRDGRRNAYLKEGAASQRPPRTLDGWAASRGVERRRIGGSTGKARGQLLRARTARVSNCRNTRVWPWGRIPSEVAAYAQQLQYCRAVARLRARCDQTRKRPWHCLWGGRNRSGPGHTDRAGWGSSTRSKGHVLGSARMLVGAGGRVAERIVRQLVRACAARYRGVRGAGRRGQGGRIDVLGDAARGSVQCTGCGTIRQDHGAVLVDADVPWQP